MAKKLLGKIDLTKIDKERIEVQTYTNKEGQEVTKKLYPIDIILLDDTKVIKEYESFNLEKVGFMATGQTKEEREAKAKSVTLGDVLEFRDKSDFDLNAQADLAAQEDNGTEEVNPEDVPF